MLAVFSMMINIILMMAPYLVFPMVNQNGYQMWLLILLMSDISLAIATRLSNKVLILPWLISYMIMIVITCVAAPVIIITAPLLVKEARSYSPIDQLQNKTIQTMSSNLPEHRDLEQEALDTMERYHPENLDEEDIRPLFSILVSILLPAWYIYTWVAAKSLYHNLSMVEMQASSTPGLRRPNRVVAWNVVQSQAQPTHVAPNQPTVQYHQHQSPTPLPWYADPPAGNPRATNQPAQYQPPPTLIYTSSEPSGGYSVNTSSSSYAQPTRY